MVAVGSLLMTKRLVVMDIGRKEMPQFYVFEMKGDKPMLADDLNKGASPSGNIQTMLILRGNWYPNGKRMENEWTK